MGKPRPSKIAMGAEDHEPKEINCMKCGEKFVSINPRNIRTCNPCKWGRRGKKRKATQEVELAKAKRTKARISGGNPDRSRKQQSKY